ncbi:DUF4249 domain-containing protein [Rasiella rasia]|uniref:DUF4249 domain-containing protein n=1 Tax=Rasiella rasia TaxID=2744027 RepID=A0A6G6GQ52_9FLAO|nr:DUF4249 family protein [Rasiella rasia]QIE60679.1 DUF4249 domain-containing protein [Rasiella rasia]
MKKLFILIAVAIVSISCEDVVEIELNEDTPKVVIDAKLTRDLATNESQVYVRITTTAPFFGTTIPTVSNAIVTITDASGTSELTHTSNGVYTANISVEDNETYTLEINYNGQVYTASEVLNTVPPLEFVEQRNDGGFSGEDIELKAFFTDPAGVENYYFFEGLSEAGNVYDTFYDEFFDGNEIFGFYLVEDIEPNDEVTFFLSGVDQQFYNFMFTLLQQSSEDGGGPFETQPATVRGNIVNTTNPDNYPLGYFRVSEISTLSYTVQ